MQYITVALNANVILLVMEIRNQNLNLFKEKWTAQIHQDIQVFTKFQVSKDGISK